MINNTIFADDINQNTVSVFEYANEQMIELGLAADAVD